MAGGTCWAARWDAGGTRGTVHGKMQGVRGWGQAGCGAGHVLGQERAGGCTGGAGAGQNQRGSALLARSPPQLCSLQQPLGLLAAHPPGGTPAPHMLVPAMPGPMPPALPTTERRGVSISRGSRQRANSARYSVLICGARRGHVGLGQGRAGVRGCPWGRRAEAQPRALPCWSVPAAGGGAASRSSAASPSVAERQRRGRAQGSGVPGTRPGGPAPRQGAPAAPRCYSRSPGPGTRLCWRSSGRPSRSPGGPVRGGVTAATSPGPLPGFWEGRFPEPGVGRRLASLPGMGPTCRVGSREARWASCSLNAFSFSSCWLQQSRRRAPALGELPGPGHPRKEAPTRAPMGASSSHHAGLGGPVPAGAPRPPNMQRCSRGPSPLHGFQERLLSLGELLLQTARMPHVPWLRRTSAPCQGVGGHPWVQGGDALPHRAPHLHAAEEGVDGRLLLAGTVAHLLDHGLEEDDGLARGRLQLLHRLPGVARWLRRCCRLCASSPRPPRPPTSTAWSSFSQPCTYAVSMSMQCARLSLRGWV